MLFLKQPLTLPFLCHKSATTSQIDSYNVSNSKLKPDLLSFVKTEITEPTALLQQQHKRGTNFIGTRCIFFNRSFIPFKNNEKDKSCQLKIHLDH